MNFIEIKNNKKFKKKNRAIFNFLTSNIEGSIFKFLGYDFFLYFIEINHGKVFYIEHNKKIVNYIAYIDSVTEKKLKNLIIKNIIKRPFFFILIAFQNINFFFKFHKFPANYLQLIHLIIKIDTVKNSSLKKKIDIKIDNLNYKICKSLNFKGVYAMYNRNNKRASKYYKKNNYTLYNKNFFFNFVKKYIK